jgi:hypothetical protein
MNDIRIRSMRNPSLCLILLSYFLRSFRMMFLKLMFETILQIRWPLVLIKSDGINKIQDKKLVIQKKYNLLFYRRLLDILFKLGDICLKINTVVENLVIIMKEPINMPLARCLLFGKPIINNKIYATFYDSEFLFWVKRRISFDCQPFERNSHHNFNISGSQALTRPFAVFVQSLL